MIFGYSIWPIIIFALLWVGCWFSIAWWMPVLCIIMAGVGTYASLSLYDRLGFYVWLVPVIGILISRSVSIFTRYIDNHLSEGINTYTLCFLLAAFSTLVVNAGGVSLSSKVYILFTEKSTFSTSYWILMFSVIIVGGIVLGYNFMHSQPAQAAQGQAQPNYQPTPQPPPQRNEETKNPYLTFIRESIFYNFYYHGTSIDAANEIWNHELWLSLISPPELWMAREFDLASDYAKDRGDGNGYVLHLDVDPSLEVIDSKDDTVYIPLDEEDIGSKEKYFKVEGVYAIRMLDLDGNVLKRRK